MIGGFHVSVHEGGGAANAALMGGADDLLPLRGRKFVAREDVAHFVIQNFGGGAGQRVEAVIAEHEKIIASGMPVSSTP